MATIDDICDFIISEVTENGKPLNNLKLQKLLYYADAWHMAFGRGELFPQRFQAWVHGPVSRHIYDRFKATKDLYSVVTAEDITPGFSPEKIERRTRLQIKSILEVYNQFTGSQLEDLTHNEEPWQKARDGFSLTDRCEVEIDKEVTRKYYAKRIKKS